MSLLLWALGATLIGAVFGSLSFVPVARGLALIARLLCGVFLLVALLLLALWLLTLRVRL